MYTDLRIKYIAMYKFIELVNNQTTTKFECMCMSSFRMSH